MQIRKSQKNGYQKAKNEYLLKIFIKYFIILSILYLYDTNYENIAILTKHSNNYDLLFKTIR